ncbi:ABC transporter permease, partial [Sulfolobus sp. C3]
MGFGTYAVRRAVDRLLLLIALVILNWFLLEGLPEALGIDPALWFLPIGQIGRSSQFQHSLLVALTNLYGFNKPIYVQFAHYFYLLFTLKFYDFQHHEYVVGEIMRALPYTIVLTVPPLIFQTILAILLGSYAAIKRNKLVDHIISNYLVLQYNIPGFFILVILWVLLAIYVKVIPISDVSVINWS